MSGLLIRLFERPGSAAPLKKFNIRGHFSSKRCDYATKLSLWERGEHPEERGCKEKKKRKRNSPICCNKQANLRERNVFKNFLKVSLTFRGHKNRTGQELNTSSRARSGGVSGGEFSERFLEHSWRESTRRCNQRTNLQQLHATLQAARS